MRFISRYRKYLVGVIPAEMALVNGLPMQTREGFRVQFQHGALMEWEKQTGLDAFQFNGKNDGENLVDRLSSYDTSVIDPRETIRLNGVDVNLREEVERRLLNNPYYGVDLIKVDEPTIPAPFRSYDELDDVEEIVEMLERTGVVDDPEALESARRYEYANRKRPAVFAALERLGAEKTEVGEEIVYS